MFCGRNYIEEVKLKMKLIDADSLYERAYKLNLDYKVSDTELRVLKRLLMEEPVVVHLPTVLSIKDWNKETKDRVLAQVKAVNETFDKCVKLILSKSEEELQ